MRSSKPVTFVLTLATIATMKQAGAQTIVQPISLTTDVGASASAAGVAITLTGQGSGTNGPATAQFGANIGCSKDNWMTTSSVGEMDCVNISLHQGGPGSDGSGVLIGVENTGLGFASDTEMQAESVDPTTDAVGYMIDIQEGVVNRGSQMYGVVYNSEAGTGVAAIEVNAENGSAWQTLLQGSNNQGETYFKVDGSGNITTFGTVTSASLTTSGSVHALSSVVHTVADTQVLRREDCGTTLRSTAAKPLNLVVPDTLPLGCRLDVIQANDGIVTFQGRGMQGEHLGAPDPRNFQTQGRYAEAQLLVDSTKTFLLRGDVGAAGASRSLDLVSDRLPAGTNVPAALYQ